MPSKNNSKLWALTSWQQLRGNGGLRDAVEAAHVGRFRELGLSPAFHPGSGDETEVVKLARRTC